MIRIRIAQIETFSIPLVDSPLVVHTGGDQPQKFLARNGASMKVAGVLNSDSRSIVGVGEVVEPVFVRAGGDDSSQILAASIETLESCCSRVSASVIMLNKWQVDVAALIDNILPLPQSRGQSFTMSRFALEQALLGLVSAALKLPLWNVLREWVRPGRPSGESDPIGIELNSLYDARDNQIPFPGMSFCLKVKIGGSLTPEESAALVNKLAENGRPDGLIGPWLRLDANQCWDVVSASAFAKGLSKCAIESIQYVEEPLKVGSIAELRTLVRELIAECPVWSEVSIAVDESLLFEGSESFVQMNPTIFIVHKPFLHGLRDSRIVGRFTDRVTITCTFETGIGLSFLASLAAALNRTTYHGIHALPEMAITNDATRRFDLTIQQSTKDASRYISIKNIL